MHRGKNWEICGFYLCDELDCGFHYHYKRDHGCSPTKPVIDLMVPIVGLNKKVRLKLVGFGDTGYNKLLDHGHEGYIFPVNFHDKPFRIDVKLSGSTGPQTVENWLKVIGIQEIDFAQAKYNLEAVI